MIEPGSTWKVQGERSFVFVSRVTARFVWGQNIRTGEKVRLGRKDFERRMEFWLPPLGPYVSG